MGGELERKRMFDADNNNWAGRQTAERSLSLSLKQPPSRSDANNALQQMHVELKASSLCQCGSLQPRRSGRCFCFAEPLETSPAAPPSFDASSLTPRSGLLGSSPRHHSRQRYETHRCGAFAAAAAPRYVVMGPLLAPSSGLIPS